MTYLFHPSEVGQIMSDPKSLTQADMPPDMWEIYKKKKKTDEDQAALAPYWRNTLSQGAKTFLLSRAKRLVYGYDVQITTKEMEKGLRCEQDSIDLYNEVFFTNYQKNTIRKQDDILNGECDIEDEDLILDIKSPWSLETFPALPESGVDTGYEWQGRAYMRLYDKPRFQLTYVMVNTPEDLIKWEDCTPHKVDHIDPAMRITRILYDRDMDLEMRMVEKCRAGQAYIESAIEAIKEAHRG